MRPRGRFVLLCLAVCGLGGLTWFVALRWATESIRDDSEWLSDSRSALSHPDPSTRYSAAMRPPFQRARIHLVVPILLEALADDTADVDSAAVGLQPTAAIDRQSGNRQTVPARNASAAALEGLIGSSAWSPLFTPYVVPALCDAWTTSVQEADPAFRSKLESALRKVASQEGVDVATALTARTVKNPDLQEAAAKLLEELTSIRGPARPDAPTSADTTYTSATHAGAIIRSRSGGTDWPKFLGPQGNNKSEESGVVRDWTNTSPSVIWTTDLGRGYAMPVVSRGRLFENSRHDDEVRLTCLASESGQPIWSFSYKTNYIDMHGYDDGPRCSPVVDEDRVYTFGPDGMLHCVSVLDGSIFWDCNTTERFGVVQNLFGVGSTPLVFEDLLIVQVGGSPAVEQRLLPGQLDDVRSNGCGIVAFDKRTGEVRYQTTDELASYASPVVSMIDGRPWCFVFARGGLVAFDPRSGAVDFQFPWVGKNQGINAATPVVVDGRVLVSECYGPGAALLKVDSQGHRVIWSDRARRRDKSLQTHWNTPVYHQGCVYGSSGRYSADAELRCVEFETGKVLWSQPGLGRSSLLYVDGHFVCLTEYGELLLVRATPERYDLAADLTPRDGGKNLLAYPAWAAPILSHGLLYARGSDRLVCLDLIPSSR